MLSKPERQQLIEIIKCLPDELSQAVVGLTTKQLTTVSIPGEWTVQQIVHHVADSHMNAVIRMKLILTMDRPPLQGYQQDDWALLADVNAVPIHASLSILQGLHARWVALFESLPDEAWGRVGLHSEYGERSIESLLVTYAEHGRIHIDQIQRVLDAQN
ncbi:MAG: DinB family protein [Anaerolineae bacterium]